MFFLLLCLIAAGLIIEVIQKRVLRIKEPDIEELWLDLEKEEWFQELLRDPKLKEWVELDKQRGLLKDPYYVGKIIGNDGHREGFINYLKEKAK